MHQQECMSSSSKIKTIMSTLLSMHLIGGIQLALIFQETPIL